jgi:hypothetical protein
MSKGGVNMARVRLHEIVEQAARNVTDADGRFHKKDHIDQVKGMLATVQLSPVTQEELKYREARKLCEDFVRTRTPRARGSRNSAIPTLYSDGSLLVLTNGDRVWMQDANRDDLIQWNRSASERVQNAMARQDDRRQYVEQRLQFWKGRDDIKHLGELERHFFNYTPDAGEEGFGEEEEDE